jgi:hypothetical protein
MSSNRQPDMGHDHGALCREEKKDVVRLITERLESVDVRIANDKLGGSTETTVQRGVEIAS